jgi:hypothetical protein
VFCYLAFKALIDTKSVVCDYPCTHTFVFEIDEVLYQQGILEIQFALIQENCTNLMLKVSDFTWCPLSDRTHYDKEVH